MRFKKNQPLVERLVNKFADREAARGELVWRWTDLRGKKQKFEQEHTAKLAKLQSEKTTQGERVQSLEAELTDRRNDMNTFSEQKGQLTSPLQTIEAQDKEFAAFVEDMERAALANLAQEIRSLELRLADAEGASRDEARRSLELYSDRVRQKE